MRALWRRIRGRRQDLRQFGITAVVTYAGIGLSLLSAPILAQVIGADGRGVLAGSFAAVQVLAWMTPLGLQRGLALQIAKRAEVSAWGVGIMTLLGVVAAIATFISAPTLANGDDRITFGIRIASCLLLLSGLGNMGDQLAMARGHVWSHNIIRSGTLLIPSLLQVVLFLFGALDLVTAYSVMLAGQLFATVFGAVLAVRACFGHSSARVPWAFSLRFWSGSALDSMAGRIDQVLLAALASAPILGVYAIAVTCANAAGGLTQSLNQVAFARFVTAEKQGQDREGRGLARASLIGSLTSAISGALVTVAVALFWLPLFGPSFADLTPVVTVLVVAKIFQGQWTLRVFHDSAKETGHAMLPASATGFAVLVICATTLYLSGALSGLTMAASFLAMCVTRLVVGESIRRRRLRTHEAVPSDGA